MDIEELIRPVVEADGLEFVELSFATEGAQKVLRVTVDRHGGLGLGQIATTSERISRRLDLEDFEEGRYLLEVSSPGLERPLREPRDFQRKTGERVKVKVVQPVAETLLGRLTKADEEGIVVATEQGERQVAYTDIASARTVFEWSDVK